jgi:hypothetical protein
MPAKKKPTKTKRSQQRPGLSPAAIRSDVRRQAERLAQLSDEVSEKLTPNRRKAALARVNTAAAKLSKLVKSYGAAANTYARLGLAWSGRTLESEREKYGDLY